MESTPWMALSSSGGARRERRAAQRADRTNQGKARRNANQPGWRSPIAFLTIAAVLVGVVIIAIALLNQPQTGPTPTGELSPPSATVPPGQAEDRTLGSASAPVQMDIWADFQCPFCGQLARSVEPPLIDQFVVPGYARFVFHDLAFLGQRSASGWDESVEAASAARCAADQDLFWQMHDWLFANQDGENEGGFAQDRLRSIAAAADLDMSAYDSCMAAGDKQASVESDSSSASASGINSTPTISLNGIFYKGKLTASDIGAAIASALGAATPAPAAPPATSTPLASATP